VTQVEVCNLALGWVGSELITSIDDDSTSARLCKALWTPTRDVVLEDREWTFAVSRIGPVAPDASAPAFGWLHRFQIPSTVLRVLRCVDADNQLIEWQREGAFVVSDQATLRMVALVRVEDTASLPPSFCHALAARLAADLAIPIAQSSSMQASMWQLYTAKLKAAAAMDGMQGRAERRTNTRGLARVR
jgi:hypothetical protein